MAEEEWEAAFDLLSLLCAVLSPMPQATQNLFEGAIRGRYGAPRRLPEF